MPIDGKKVLRVNMGPTELFKMRCELVAMVTTNIYVHVGEHIQEKVERASAIVDVIMELESTKVAEILHGKKEA